MFLQFIQREQGLLISVTSVPFTRETVFKDSKLTELFSKYSLFIHKNAKSKFRWIEHLSLNGT